MNRNKRMLIVMGIAVVTATLASFAVFEAIRRRPTEKVEIPTGSVVVASGPLEMGVLLTKEHLKLVAWPARSPIADSFTKIEDVLNHGLIAGVVENEPITKSKLAPLEAGAGLSPAIKTGMRAMSVKVNEVIGVAGFVVPGTRVDVLVTIREDKGSVARAVATNVQVLTAGTRYDEEQVKKEGKPIPSTVVTLMVTPIDATRIALASTEGLIVLALRNPLDTQMLQAPAVRTSELMRAGLVETPAEPGKSRPTTRHPPAPTVAPPVLLHRPREVQTYKATKREVVIVS